MSYRNFVILIVAGFAAATARAEVLSGKLTDLATGEPLAGVAVIALEPGVRVVSADDGSYSFGDLPAGTVTVRAQKDGFITQELTVNLAPSRPVAPSQLTAAASGSGQITLTWSDNSLNVTGYRLERRVGSGTWVHVATITVDNSSYIDSGLVARRSYHYRVRAINAAGASAYSNIASATAASRSAAAQVKPR